VVNKGGWGIALGAPQVGPDKREKWGPNWAPQTDEIERAAGGDKRNKMGRLSQPPREVGGYEIDTCSLGLTKKRGGKNRGGGWEDTRIAMGGLGSPCATLSQGKLTKNRSAHQEVKTKETRGGQVIPIGEQNQKYLKGIPPWGAYDCSTQTIPAFRKKRRLGFQTNAEQSTKN